MKDIQTVGRVLDWRSQHGCDYKGEYCSGHSFNGGMVRLWVVPNANPEVYQVEISDTVGQNYNVYERESQIL